MGILPPSREQEQLVFLVTTASVSLQGFIWVPALPDVLWPNICFSQAPAVSGQLGAASSESRLGLLPSRACHRFLWKLQGGLAWGLKLSRTSSGHRASSGCDEVYTAPRPQQPAQRPLADSVDLKSAGTCSVASLLRHQVPLTVTQNLLLCTHF